MVRTLSTGGASGLPPKPNDGGGATVTRSNSFQTNVSVNKEPLRVSSQPARRNENFRKRISDAEMQRRRERGLCFRCEEKWQFGHVCRNPQLQVLIAAEDEEEEDVAVEDTGTPQTQEDGSLELSMNSIVGIPSINTMKVKDGNKPGNMDGYVGFHAALRHAYSRFIKDLAKQCKELVRHHLDSVTSPYSLVCYENEFQGGFGSSAASIYKSNPGSAGLFSLELSDGGASAQDDAMRDQENRPPEKSAPQTTPGKAAEAREAMKESQMTVPETPSPDQPFDPMHGGAKELGNGVDIGARKRVSRMTGLGRNPDHMKISNGGLLFGNRDGGARSGSAYAEICSSAAQHFSRIRGVLVERNVTSALNSGFLTPCRDRLVLAFGLDLFAVNDEKFMDMFVAPGAIDVLQNERQSLQKRQKVLQSCLNEFKSVARSL